MTALAALFAFIAWSLTLVSCIALFRVWKVVSFQEKANAFPSGVPHGADWYWRLNRAHINSIENLAVFAPLVLAGALLKIQSGVFDTVAWVVVGARVLQSLVHISSNRSVVVLVRFTAFSVQLACYFILLVLLWRSLAA